MMDFTRSELEGAELLLVIDPEGAYRWSSDRTHEEVGLALRTVSIEVSLEAISTAGDPLAQIAAWHRTAAKDVDDALRRAIAARRVAGASWTDVGRAFGVTRQAAWERFRRFDQLGVVDPVEDLLEPAPEATP